MLTVQELDSLMPLPDYPSTTATPSPGLCVKTKNAKGEKFFLNLCKLREVPAPPPMSEQELERVVAEVGCTLQSSPITLTPRRTTRTCGECP